MKNKNRGAVLVLSCLSLLGCSEPTEQNTVNQSLIRAVKLFDINLSTTHTHEFPGEVEASQQAYLGFRVPGVIKKFHVFSGQHVKKGDLLAELDPTDFKLAFDAQQAQYDLTKIQFERAEVLVKDFLLSRSDFDNFKTELAIATSELGTAQANLSYTKIFAPYDGVIGATYKENNEYVSAQEQVMSLQAENSIDIVFAAPERLLPVFTRVRGTEQPIQALVTFPVIKEQSFIAAVKSFDTVADDKTGSFKTKLTMLQPDEVNLLPGMSANISVSFDLAGEEFSKQIPETAIMKEGNQTFVWRLNNENLLEKVSVNLDANYNVIAGLTSGDRIVATGVNELSAGQKVKRWVKERGL